MRDIDNFFSEAPHQKLYHYTGIQSLLGIAESRKLWASHIYYLNDSSEVLHACSVLRNILLERESDGSKENDEFLVQLRKWLDTFEHTYHIFTFSLSEKSSLLSQWRGYTPHGKGVSLAFEQDTISALIERPGFKFAKCLYTRQEHTELLSGLVKKMLITFGQRRPLDTSKNHPSQKYFSFFEEFRGDFLQILSIIKNSAFEEEQEWRIISPYFANYADSDIKFREGASMLMPYIELDLPRDGRLFNKIILGPSEHPNLSMSALAAFLGNKRISNHVVLSGIPYRKWS